MPPSYREMMCPRCRAAGDPQWVIVKDGYGVCGKCNTTWMFGPHDEPIAVE